MGPETLDHHVAPSKRGELTGAWYFCPTPDCDVVYFCGDDVLDLSETTSIPFDKSDAPDRLVCFCFGHTVAELLADLREHGESTIRASIQSACKAGRDECRLRNPQGRCCLGNVGKVLKRASASDDTRHGCCGGD